MGGGGGGVGVFMDLIHLQSCFVLFSAAWSAVTK